MDDQTLLRELEQLKRDVSFHNYRYFVLDDPLVSDAEFDKLVRRLKEIEAEHPEWVTPDSPTQRAGGTPLEKFVKVRHPRPILSLAAGYKQEDVTSWYERIRRVDERVEKT